MFNKEKQNEQQKQQQPKREQQRSKTERKMYVSGIQTLELTHKNAHYSDT